MEIQFKRSLIIISFLTCISLLHAIFLASPTEPFVIHDTNNDELNDQPDSMVRTDDEPFIKSIPFLHDYEPTSALAEMEASKNFLVKIGCSLPNADNGSSDQDILDPFQRDIQVYVKCM